ncbi:MAG: glycosyltransferase family 1 protein [Pirellulaceae bacterium]|jgi:glycosyltransferase involved in cell wall biosynthesis|nr:glycosyltransferase family 1 protein [Pirellulaceae bacterium]MDP7019236.1 glycosyltransferase family 1 protein [Pirellulaceae bacterium]
MTTFGGDGGKSGISQYIINLLNQFNGLSSNEMDLFLYDSERQIFAQEGSAIAALPFSDRWRSPLMNIAWHQLSLQSWCRRRDYDVMFLPAGNRRLPATCPCPTVGTVHDFSSLHVSGKYDWARLFYIKQVLPRLVRRLTRVLTVSESSKRDIVQYAGVPEERVTVTPLGVDHSTFHPRDPEESIGRIGKRYKIDRPYILYVSRIEHPGKNHIKLIEAFEILKKRSGLPHQLVLAGSDWNGAEHVHLAAERTSCAKDIVFTGFAPASDVPDLYCASDLFVFPSLYEGFGLPVLEAMACGIPTACSNVSSLPEVAGDAAPQFNPHDAEEIAAAMEPILTDAAVHHDFSRRGVEQAGRFTWEATAKQTLEVIQSAANEG